MDDVYLKLKRYNDTSKLDVDGSFYKNQQTFVGMILDEFCTHSKTETHIVKLRYPLRKLAGYYIFDTPIVDQLIKRCYSVRYSPSHNHILIKIKFKDPRINKNIVKGKFDWFTNECIKLFETEDDFKYLSSYARPGFDVTGSLTLDQPAESCNL